MSAEPAAAAAAPAAPADAADTKQSDNNVLSTPQKALNAGGARKQAGTPFTPGQLSKPRQAPEGTPGQSATLKRALEAQEWTAELAVDLSKWFISVLGDASTMHGVTTADDFFGRLQSGVELCQVVNKFAPEYNLPVNTDAKARSFQAFDNLEYFLKAARKIGVNSVSLFEVDDLTDRKSDKLVVNTLLQLSDCAQEQFGVPRVSLRDELRAALFGSPSKSFGAGGGAKKGQSTPAPSGGGGRDLGSAMTAAAHGVSSDSAVVGSAHKRGHSKMGHAVTRGVATGMAAYGGVSGVSGDGGDSELDEENTGGAAGAGAGADGHDGDSELDDEHDDDAADEKNGTGAGSGADGDSGAADGGRKLRCKECGSRRCPNAPASGDSCGHNHKSGSGSGAGGKHKGRCGQCGCCGGVRLRRDTRDELKILVALGLAATHGFFFWLKRSAK